MEKCGISIDEFRENIVKTLDADDKIFALDYLISKFPDPAKASKLKETASFILHSTPDIKLIKCKFYTYETSSYNAGIIKDFDILNKEIIGIYSRFDKLKTDASKDIIDLKHTDLQNQILNKIIASLDKCFDNIDKLGKPYNKYNSFYYKPDYLEKLNELLSNYFEKFGGSLNLIPKMLYEKGIKLDVPAIEEKDELSIDALSAAIDKSLRDQYRKVAKSNITNVLRHEIHAGDETLKRYDPLVEYLRIRNFSPEHTGWHPIMSRFFSAYSKNEKISAVTKLLDMILITSKFKGEKFYFKLTARESGALLNGKLGSIIRELKLEDTVKAASHIVSTSDSRRSLK